MPAPVIFPFDIPVSSLTISLEGTADLSATGFIFSPSGGTLASGSASGVTSWSYDFILMAEEEVFSVQSIDASGNISPSASALVTYGVTPPLILTPGTAKSLTDVTSTSGSTSTEFKTLSGDFLQDKVLVKDFILANSGKNRSESQEITEVGDTFVKTLPFSNPWEEGDDLFIYKQSERPTFTSNKLTVKSSGRANIDAQKVLYTLDTINTLKLHSQVSGPYEISSANDSLHIAIGAEEKTINLTQGSGISASDLVDDINSFYTETVAFVDGSTFYLGGTRIKIFPATGNSFYGFEANEYFISLEIDTPASFDLITGEDDFFDLVVEETAINFSLGAGTFSRQNLIDKINSLSSFKVAFNSPNNMVILSSEKIFIKKDHTKSNFNKSLLGQTNFDPTSGEWNVSFNVLASTNTLKVYTLDAFYKLTSPSSLTLNYKIDSPTLDTDLSEPTNINIFSVTGKYDVEGVLTFVNAEEALTSEGFWSTNLSNLDEGDNPVFVTITDIFGVSSDPLEFVVVYENKNNQPVVSDPPSSGISWTPLAGTPSFANEDVIKTVETISKIFDPIIAQLNRLTGFLKAVRAFILDTVIGPITALRLALQAFIDEILEVIDSLFNGAGIFVLSTIPKYKDISGVKEFMSFFEGGFPGFNSKVVSSFDDTLDPFRPQLNENTVAGGYALVAADTGGVTEFLETLDSLTSLFTKEFGDNKFRPVQNLKATGENQRVVLTWESAQGFNPTTYEVLRAEVAGGKPLFKQIMSGVARDGQSTFIQVPDREESTGEHKTEYESIGLINTTLVTNYKFIDGNPLVFEEEEKENNQNVLEGTISLLKATEDFIVNNIGESNEALENGKTYYYKVVPLNGGFARGPSYDVVATAGKPELEVVTEDLVDQVNGTDIVFLLKSAIYDAATGNLASDPADNHITITSDGAKVAPDKVYYGKGAFRLKQAPKTSCTATYSSKKEVNTTRASITGTNQEPFIIKRNDADTNQLEIIVGPKSSSTSVGGTISLIQKIQLVSDFKVNGVLQDFVELKADQVADRIRSNIFGSASLRVLLDKKARIVLVDDSNPDMYLGSALTIVKGNTALGFTEGTVTAGPTGGTPPDWFSIRPADLFPVVNDLLRYVENAANQLLSSIESATKALQDYIELLIQKVQDLINIATTLKNLLTKLAEVLTIKGKVYYLKIPPQIGGNTYLKNALLEATGAPDASFAAGVILVYGDGATQKALDFLLGHL